VSARAKLFTHGGSQAVRLPKAFRFEGAEVSIRRDGESVILEPLKLRPESWDAFWARIDAVGSGPDLAVGTDQDRDGLDVQVAFD
jgi:antitoxin VapB